MKNLFYKQNQGPTEYALLPQSPAPDRNSSGTHTLTTTDATATTIISIPAPTGSTIVVEGIIVGIVTSATHINEKVAYKFTGAFSNVAGTVALVGTANIAGGTFEDTNVTGATVTVVADDTNKAGLVKVTGVASHDIKWVVSYDYLKIIH